MSIPRLAPSEWFPAGRSDITARRVILPDGFGLRMLEAGPASGQPVVLLHGWAVSAYLWRHNMPALAEAGFHVFAPDLPGHGRSDATAERDSFTLAAMTDRVSELLDALGVGETPVVAQSMSGRIAVELARRSPGRITRLVLFGPVGFGDIPPARAFAPFIPVLPGTIPSLLVSRRAVEIVQRRVHGKLGWFTERDIDEYWAPTQFPDVVRAQIQLLREFDWTPLDPATLAALRTPTLVAFGTEDRTVRPVHAERLAGALPEGRLVWIEGGGHVVMEEVPAIVNAMIIEWISAGHRNSPKRTARCR